MVWRVASLTMWVLYWLYGIGLCGGLGMGLGGFRVCWCRNCGGGSSCLCTGGLVGGDFAWFGF